MKDSITLQGNLPSVVLLSHPPDPNLTLLGSPRTNILSNAETQHPISVLQNLNLIMSRPPTLGSDFLKNQAESFVMEANRSIDNDLVNLARNRPDEIGADPEHKSHRSESIQLENQHDQEEEKV